MPLDLIDLAHVFGVLDGCANVDKKSVLPDI